MYQVKIFAGTFRSFGGQQSKHADDYFNEWITNHPNIEIIKFKYQQSRYGDHSIAILYKEEI